jgi:ubiquinone/menaquinone biosynthesis C-methylase UbiE
LPSEEELINLYPQDYYAHLVSASPKGMKAKLKLYLIQLYYGQYSENKLISLLQKLSYLCLNHTINEPPIIVNGKLLDIGCGNGEYINMAKHFGWDTYGIELNENAVNIARSIGLKVKKGVAEKIEYKDEFFNVVRVWNVLEHIVSPRKALLEIVRVLKKGGYLLLYVPNFNSIDRKYFAEHWASLEVPRHLHHFSIESLEAYLHQVGLVIEKRMYPGAIFSMLIPTIKIMRENKIGTFSIKCKVIAVIVVKIFNRLPGRYSKDIGICILAKKI